MVQPPDNLEFSAEIGPNAQMLHQSGHNNQLEMSLESSFFDGSSFIEDGGKALVNSSNQNLEELLQADDVDPDTFLIKRNSLMANHESQQENVDRGRGSNTHRVRGFVREDHRAKGSLSPLKQ